MNRSLSGSSQHFQSRSPVDNAEDDSDYPELSDWLGSLDEDYFRSRWGHRFSEFSVGFEHSGFTSLLQLESISLQELVGMIGIDETAAERLLRFAQEDIAEIRANRPLRSKRARYSY